MSNRLMKEMFEYFAALARLNVKQVRTLDAGTVNRPDPDYVFLRQIPKHTNIAMLLDVESSLGPGIVLSINKPSPPVPPNPPEAWYRWARAQGIRYDPTSTSIFPHPRSFGDGVDVDPEAERAADDYESALEQWRPGYVADSRALRLYSQLWETRQKIATEPDRFEFILGLGTISWKPDGIEVKRPLMTVPARILFDPEAQRIDVEVDETEAQIETDMLPPHCDPGRVEATRVESQLAELESVLDPSEIGPVFAAFVANLPSSGGRGEWDGSALLPGRAGPDPVVSYAPMIGIRSRSQHARIQLLEGLAGAQNLTTAMRSLIEITAAQVAELPRGEEIEQRFHEDLLLPQPSSKAQRQIALSMERNPLTVVFGPPGTGKTYTIANLVAHLLAQGKRVLITAEKEEALHEVRDKVIGPIQDLVVPVLRGSAKDKKRLAQSIDRINKTQQRATLEERSAEIDMLVSKTSALQADRLRLLNELASAWESERAMRFETAPYAGDLESAARRIDADRSQYSWFTDQVNSPTVPLTEEELGSIRDLADDSVQEAGALPVEPRDPRQLLTQSEAGDIARRITQATELSNLLSRGSSRPAAKSTPSLYEEAVNLADGAEEAAANLASLEDSPHEWAAALIEDARQGHLENWRGLADRTAVEVGKLQHALNRLGPHELSAHGTAAPVVRGAALLLADSIAPDKTLKRFLRSAQVKEAINLLDSVRVDGSVIDTRSEAKIAVAWADAAIARTHLLDDWAGRTNRLDSLTDVQTIDVAKELANQVTEAIELADKASEALAPIFQAGIALEDEWSATEVSKDAEAIRWSAQRAHLAALSSRIAGIRESLDTSEPGYARMVSALERLEGGDPHPWSLTLDSLKALRALRAKFATGSQAVARLTTYSPTFAASYESSRSEFFANLGSVREAARWAHSAAELERAKSRQPLRAQLERTESDLQDRIHDLATARSWRWLRQRLDNDPGLTRDLAAYAFAQGRVPKGRAAKSYPTKQRAAQRALRQCWDAVPAWVMSLDQAAEMFGSRALDSDEPLFDVVIIDEASQSPISSAFALQLAHSVAVVGDPYQTAPPDFRKFTALQSALNQISDEDVRLRLSPDASLWDAAAIAVPKISLTEHYRCPPEIIGWAEDEIYRKLADIRLEVLTGTDPQTAQTNARSARRGGRAQRDQPASRGDCC